MPVLLGGATHDDRVDDQIVPVRIPAQAMDDVTSIHRRRRTAAGNSSDSSSSSCKDDYNMQLLKALLILPTVADPLATG